MPRGPWSRSTSRGESADKSGMRADSAFTTTNRDVRAAWLRALVDRDCSDRKRGHATRWWGQGRQPSAGVRNGLQVRQMLDDRDVGTQQTVMRWPVRVRRVVDVQRVDSDDGHI